MKLSFSPEDEQFREERSVMKLAAFEVVAILQS